MNARTVWEAVVSGGKTALLSSAAGGTVLLLYSFAAGDRVVYLSYAILALALLSVFLGGIRGGMVSGAMGWAHGGIVAGCYLLLVLLVKLLVSPAAGFDSNGIMSALGLLCAGAIGGVMGINVRFMRRKRIGRRYLDY